MNIKPVEKKDITCDLYYCFEEQAFRGVYDND